MLHLVRHARPGIDPARPASDWHLEESAAIELTALRQSGALPSHGCWTSSPEPKALETARALTDEPVEVDDDLREAVRPAEWLEADEFRRRVVASFGAPERPVSPGWVPLVETSMRVRSAADRALSRAGAADVVLVGHGTSLTLLVASLTGEPPDVGGWCGMLMPDHCAIDLDVRRLLSGWGDWTT